MTGDYWFLFTYTNYVFFFSLFFNSLHRTPSVVSTHGHTGQLPRGPTIIGGHANIWMLCTACFLMFKSGISIRAASNEWNRRLDCYTVVKELRSKMFGQHPGYFKAVFLKQTRIIIVSIYKYTVYILFWIMMLYDCYYY